MLGIVMEMFVFLTAWTVFQRPMTDYEPLVTFVVAFQVSILGLLGVLVFVIPTLMARVRNYVENILMEEYE